jgi:hypothetical protein
MIVDGEKEAESQAWLDGQCPQAALCNSQVSSVHHVTFLSIASRNRIQTVVS